MGYGLQNHASDKSVGNQRSNSKPLVYDLAIREKKRKRKFQALSWQHPKKNSGNISTSFP